jgi:hypothetical protein
VHDALRVRRVERIGHVEPELEDLARRETIGRDPAAERLALEALHHDERAALVLADVVDRADVRVVERRGRLRLALEALASGLVLEVRFRQELHRHRAVKARVLGLVDDAHPAGAQPLDDAVVRDDLTDHLILSSS